MTSQRHLCAPSSIKERKGKSRGVTPPGTVLGGGGKKGKRACLRADSDRCQHGEKGEEKTKERYFLRSYRGKRKGKREKARPGFPEFRQKEESSCRPLTKKKEEKRGQSLVQRAEFTGKKREEPTAANLVEKGRGKRGHFRGRKDPKPSAKRKGGKASTIQISRQKGKGAPLG